ncbi:MAG: Txe/YoeB family addiction module toxin [Chlorobium sp.]
MGKYTVILTPEATEELIIWHKIGDKSTRRKIEKILLELSEHPTMGTGKAERLRGDLSGYWSRRVNKKERIIYKIIDSVVTVQVFSLRGHYGDSLSE